MSTQMQWSSAQISRPFNRASFRPICHSKLMIAVMNGRILPRALISFTSEDYMVVSGIGTSFIAKCLSTWRAFLSFSCSFSFLRSLPVDSDHTTHSKRNRHLKPGGYLEQMEISVEFKSDNNSTDNTILQDWGRQFFRAGDIFGKTFRIYEEAKPRMIAAGFEDVVERVFKCPVGDWPEDPKLKELGRVMRLWCDAGWEDWLLMLMTRVLGVSKGAYCRHFQAWKELTVSDWR